MTSKCSSAALLSKGRATHKPAVGGPWGQQAHHHPNTWGRSRYTTDCSTYSRQRKAQKKVFEARIIEQVVRDLKVHLVPTLLAMGRDTFH